MQFEADQWVVCAVFGWFVGGLANLWLVCGQFGQFVAGLWVVLSFTSNEITNLLYGSFLI